MRTGIVVLILTAFPLVSNAQNQRLNDGKAHYETARKLFEEGEFAKSEAHLDTAIAYNPLFQDSYLLRGLIHERDPDFRKAIIDYKSLVTLNSQHKEGWFALGNAFYELGSYEDALESYRAVVSIPENAETSLVYYDLDLSGSITGMSSQRSMEKVIHNQMGLCLYKLDRLEESEEQFKIAVSIDGLYSDAWVNLGMLSEDKGLQNKAFGYYEMALRADPNNEEAQFNYSRLVPERSRLQTLDRMIELNPSSPLLYNERGLIHLDSDRYELAFSDFRSALKTDSLNYRFWYHLGLAQSALKHYKDAINSYNRSMKMEPGFLKAASAKANTLNRMGHYAKAIEIYTKVIDREPDNATVLYNRGIALYRLKLKDEGCRDFKTASKLNFKNAEAALERSCENQ